MIPDEDEQPRELASRRMSWPAFGVAFAGLFAGLFGSVEAFFANIITVLGMHLNHTYDKADADKADASDAPIIRNE